MWLKLALNVSLILFISACSPSDKAMVDKLNSLSYAYHYRNIDSTEYYAQRAYDLSAHYASGRAEAMNHRAFRLITQMAYDQAEACLDTIPQLTDNQVELLVCYVQQMRLCQRRSHNKDFHDYRERAINCLKRIDEERGTLDDHLQQRLRYGESEFAIVNSTYYYYVGLERQSIEELQAIDPNDVRRDTAQYLNYLYNVGAGGIITEGSPEEIYQEEMDFLSRCLTVAQRFHIPYFEAQAKEAVAEHTGDLEMAEDALHLFEQFGDVYQIAGAYRTLASCYHALGNDSLALRHLNLALADSAINQAPDLVASIREQLSVVYAALNDKDASDQNRNLYLDVQEQTRQDRELEARAAQYDKSAIQLNWMLAAVVAAILLLVFLLWLFNYLNRRRQEDHELDDVLEQKADDLKLRRLSVERSECRSLEQRAKVSLVMSIIPLIDRIRHEVSKVSEEAEAGQTEEQVSRHNAERLEYIRELTDKINEQNDLLTQWIQMRQGELSLHVESFPLQPLFDIVARGKTGFEMKGVTLKVEPTEATVKADRVLTLFMINTLADNARKFTDAGGSVTITAADEERYVEISVADTGRGMDEESLAHVFNHKLDGGHGFGLMNCKGIIEKYRKMSQLFSVCQISAESELGKGSRFFFRLPKGKKVVAGIVWLIGLVGLLGFGGTTTAAAQDYLSQAHVYADSAYFCNVNQHYEKTLQFADSCRKYLNEQYLSLHPQGNRLMLANGDTSQTPAEILWLRDSLDTNYQIILDIRNESAVAALALHKWEYYAYNNKVYTQLFKELSADNTLADYCRNMQQSQSNKRIAMILLIIILLLIFPAYYMLYYRHKLYDRHRRERIQLENIEMADDELRRAELEDNKLHVVNAVLDNCLSALKHETMYYPSRISQLVGDKDIRSLGEVVDYYRNLYGILSEQAMHQVEQVKLHIGKMELYGQQVLGDANLLHHLFDILKPEEVRAEVRDGNYVAFDVRLGADLSDFDYLLCRQIVRDHGDATLHRGCGISVQGLSAQVILPAAKK